MTAGKSPLELSHTRLSKTPYTSTISQRLQVNKSLFPLQAYMRSSSPVMVRWGRLSSASRGLRREGINRDLMLHPGLPSDRNGPHDPRVRVRVRLPLYRTQSRAVRLPLVPVKLTRVAHSLPLSHISDHLTGLPPSQPSPVCPRGSHHRSRSGTLGTRSGNCIASTGRKGRSSSLVLPSDHRHLSLPPLPSR